MNEIPEIASKSHLEKLINNRDYSVLINYNPPARCLNSEHSNQTFTHDLCLLEIRATLLSCIYYSAYMVKELSVQDNKCSPEINGVNFEDKSSKSEYLDKINLYLEKLKNIYTQLESDPPIPVSKSVFGSFFSSKLFVFNKSKIMLTIIINFIEFIQMLGSTVKNSVFTDDEIIYKIKTNATELTIGFEKSIAYCQCIISKTVNEIDSSLKLEGRKEVLEILTIMIDVSSLIIYH